jgi:hypothetical protein
MVKKNFIDHTTKDVVRIELPACPECGSTASRCRRPSGHEAQEWHVARELLLAPLIGWPEWKPGVVCDSDVCADAAAEAREAGIKLG